MNLQDHIVCAIPARQEDIIRNQNEGRSFAERGNLDASHARDVRRLRNVAEVSEHHHSEETLFTKRSVELCPTFRLSLAVLYLVNAKEEVDQLSSTLSIRRVPRSIYIGHPLTGPSITNQPHSTPFLRREQIHWQTWLPLLCPSTYISVVHFTSRKLTIKGDESHIPAEGPAKHRAAPTVSFAQVRPVRTLN
jgi:hypothetical protein